MKKVLLVALAVATMTSCMKDQVISQKQSAIGFADTFVEKVHKGRAAVDPSTTTASIDAFDVWGFMDQNTGLVFDQMRVNRVGNDANGKGIWENSPLAYWLPNHTYYVAALAPVDNANITVTLADDGKLSNADASKGALGTVAFKNIEGCKVDLLYAQPAPITTGDDVIANEPAKVGLQFAHLLSKVKFTFVNGFQNEFNDLEVKNIQMQVPAEGSVDLTQTTRPYLWDVVTTNNDITLSFGNAINKLDATKGVSLGSSESGECEFECLTLPIQNGTTLVPHLNVTFDVVLYQGDQVAIAKSNRLAKLVLDGSLTGLEKGIEQGKAYRINATLNSENITDDKLLEIKFDDVKVDEWITAENPEVVYDAGAINTQPAQ